MVAERHDHSRTGRGDGLQPHLYQRRRGQLVLANTTWFHDGDAAQSGTISNYGQSWMATTVDGPGTIRFYWKVSSQAKSDYLEFFLDGVRQDRISGTSDWLGCSYTVTGSGNHALQWRYIKNGYGSAGSDCGWVDYVQSPMPSDWNSITQSRGAEEKERGEESNNC